jgi:hypothetical protein
MHTDLKTDDPVAKEIIDLHIFFEDWFRGDCRNTDQVFKKRLLSRMDIDFYMVMPNGESFYGEQFWPDLRKAHGSNPKFEISLRNFVRKLQIGRKTFVANYEEWQKNAKNTRPANNGRVSTAVFVVDSEAPNGVKWVNVHETWLPENRIAAETFDW